jgi:UDP-3-O-[3-hydroxymyristoyl] glucosamine N-acyltransferase
MTLAELAEALECRLEGDGSIEITGAADLATAGPGQVTFYGNPRYRAEFESTRASAVIVGDDAPAVERPLLRARSAYYTFARALALLHPPIAPPPGVHPLAAVADDAVLGDGVSIGPFVAVGRGVRIGARSIVHAHVAIGDGVSIGADCLIHAHVSLREAVRLGDRVIVQNGAVVGSDGFGFTPDPQRRHHKIPQVGTVVVEDDVEIGANTTIDRAVVGETRIGAGTKIDNLVQVGHNVRVGQHVLLAAQVGISGSATLEDRVTLGGQVGVAGHITVGQGAIAAGQSGVTNSVEPGRFVTGYPAIDNRRWRKASVVFAHLPELRALVKDLDERLSACEGRLRVSGGSGGVSAPPS